ncbi:TlpA disulfide reductase family protein [uncultured Paracoccus sp.]|uniref:TlpA disulfide reductase family protein n=1 Tax=uncultured Paracoccus sp. TaxID=189685 RepID=UPI0026121DD9|nr:TlpA disulfide reductase family protein [uncultured Paracoccus sp.]
MTGISIGPLAFDPARFGAVLAILLYVSVAELVSWVQRRRGRPDTGLYWSTLTLIGWVVGARIGFVAANAAVFADHPLDAIKLWQGGFAPAAGWIAGGLVLLVALLGGQPGALRTTLPAAAVAALTLLLTAASFPPPDIRLPALSLQTLDGRAAQLAGQGRPVVLNLWATWCPPCRREMPMMMELAASTPDVRFVFANQGESTAQIRSFLADEGLPADDVLRDNQQQLTAELGVAGMPSTLVFDADGDLVAARTGELSRAALVGLVDSARQ